MATGNYKRTMFFFKKEILKRNNVDKLPTDKYCYRYADNDDTGNPGFIRYRDSMNVVKEENNITVGSVVVSVYATTIIEIYNVIQTTCA